MPASVTKIRVLPSLLVLAVVLVGQVEAWTVDVEGSSRPVVVGCALVATAALFLLRAVPEAVAAIVVGALVVKDLDQGPGELIVLLLCGVVSLFAVGLLLPRRRSRLALLAVLALATLGVALGPEEVPEVAFSAIALGGPWLAGRAVRASREHARVLEELAVLRQREAEDRATLAAAAERERIAREIHDLVGHSVSLMVLQAGAAEEVLSERPDEARDALRAVQETGRRSLTDLHGVLGLLRSDQSYDAGPLPGLSDLGPLAEGVSRAGVDVTCDVAGGLDDAPAGLGLTAYRVVQEALTNVVRHAGANHACVRVWREDRDLCLEVLDDGRGAASEPARGHGLAGMRERVAMYGGELRAGPEPGRGFGVRVRLPIGGAA